MNNILVDSTKSNEAILIFIKNLIIDLKYKKYCLQYSLEYLSGCPIYQYINKYGNGSFTKAYEYSLLNEFFKNI